MTGLDPVLHPRDRQASYNDSDADRQKDQDELHDYADQGPLPFPTVTAVQGPLEQFLSDMPDFEESLQRALDRRKFA